MSGLIGFVIGCIVMGVVANRRPEWFAKVVRVANAVDDKVNASLPKVG